MNDSLNAVMIVPTGTRCSNELVIRDDQSDYAITIRCEVLKTTDTHSIHSAKIDRVELIWK